MIRKMCKVDVVESVVHVRSISAPRSGNLRPGTHLETGDKLKSSTYAPWADGMIKTCR